MNIIEMNWYLSPPYIWQGLILRIFMEKDPLTSAGKVKLFKGSTHTVMLQAVHEIPEQP